MSFSKSANWSIVALIILLICVHARAAVVRTVDGRTLEGEVKLEEKALFIAAKAGSAVKITRENLLRLSLAPPVPVSRGIVLNDGTVLTVDQIVSVTASAGVKFVHKGKEATLPQDQVARIVFAPASADKPAGAGSGAILINGDFFEGELMSIADISRVQISSVIFGIRTLPAEKQVAAVVLRNAARLSGDNLLSLSDGSQFAVQNVVFKKGGIQADDQFIAIKDITEMRCNGLSIQPLTAVSAPRSAGAQVVVDATPLGIAPTLLGVSGEQLIGLSGAGSVSFDIPAGYQRFMSTFGVPRSIMPGVRMTLVVLGDDKELLHIGPKSSIDDPETVSVSLAGIRRVTFQARSDEPAVPGCVLLLDPQLVKIK